MLSDHILISEEHWEGLADSPLKDTIIRGLYNPTQFVLRLRPDIHRILQELEAGIYARTELRDDQVQAFSTLLHESIHWWQHVGSTFGFLASLSYPVQAHATMNDLRTLVERGDLHKPIFQFNLNRIRETGNENDEILNRIVNNWFDIHFASILTYDPVLANKVIRHDFFESQGHAFYILWSSCVRALASCVDADFKFLPDVRKWNSEFVRLKEEKALGFYFGSDVGIPPFGIKAIFEGQARFCQLQYLYFGLGKSYDIEEFKKQGLMKGVYNEAFSFFLEVIGEKEPDTIDSPLIGLFLLICDMAINPVEGFPMDISHFESFIISNDPGIRFGLFCHAVKEHPQVKNMIINYTKEEYVEVSSLLSSFLSTPPPILGLEKINNWIKGEPTIQELLQEEYEFKFSPINTAVRLFFSKFLRFNESKLEHPQFFVWTGVCMSPNKDTGISLKIAEQLFHKHKALFTDGTDGDVYPTIFEHASQENIQASFDQFYQWNSVYDMVKQWIIKDGDFSYNYDWLTKKFMPEDVKKWACGNFQQFFKIHPDDINVL